MSADETKPLPLAPLAGEGVPSELHELKRLLDLIQKAHKSIVSGNLHSNTYEVSRSAWLDVLRKSNDVAPFIADLERGWHKARPAEPAESEGRGEQRIFDVQGFIRESIEAANAALTTKLTAAESEAERLRGIAESMRRQIEDRIAERDEALTALADTEATADLYSRLAAAMEFVPLPETLTDERQKASAARLHAADPVVFFNQAEIADQTKGR